MGSRIGRADVFRYLNGGHCEALGSKIALKDGIAGSRYWQSLHSMRAAATAAESNWKWTDSESTGR